MPEVIRNSTFLEITMAFFYNVKRQLVFEQDIREGHVVPWRKERLRLLLPADAHLIQLHYPPWGKTALLEFVSDEVGPGLVEAVFTHHEGGKHTIHYTDPAPYSEVAQHIADRYDIHLEVGA